MVKELFFTKLFNDSTSARSEPENNVLPLLKSGIMSASDSQ
jgi:hypothetical protein